MTKSTPCYMCKARVEQTIPRRGLTRLFGQVTRNTWNIRFNYLRMHSIDDAVTAQDVVASSFWTEVDLCSDCWGEVLAFIHNTAQGRRP